MNAIEALNALRNKRFADRTEIEKLIVLMWEEVNGYEDIAMKAAAELTAFVLKLETREREQAQETDEFNAGYEAYQAGLDLDDSGRTYRSVLPDDVPSYDVFEHGYAWAKFQEERAQAVK
jgi:hypothetical protein